MNGVDRHLRLHAGLQHERARAAPEIERRARAVGVALVLAQVHVDAADELAAEHHVQHEQRVVVGRLARHADMADAQLRLRGAGPVHERDAFGRRWRRQRQRRRPARSCAAPARPTSPNAASTSVARARRGSRRPTATSVVRDGANIASVKRGDFVERRSPAATASVPIGRWP